MRESEVKCFVACFSCKNLETLMSKEIKPQSCHLENGTLLVFSF